MAIHIIMVIHTVATSLTIHHTIHLTIATLTTVQTMDLGLVLVTLAKAYMEDMNAAADTVVFMADAARVILN